ncbi:MAG: hypothetical protein ACYTKD_16950 [Planctomycetota bacterium]|jgi:hypothetical protein
MNNKKLRKALMHMGHGKSIKDIGQYVDIEWRVLQRELEEMGVTSPAQARTKLARLEEELVVSQRTKNSEPSKKAGDVVPEFKGTPEIAQSKQQFDRAAAIVNQKENSTKERIPLAEHQEFRQDLRDRSWVKLIKKWSGKRGLSEDLLMEQAVLLSPKVANDRFGFGSIDDNMENKKAPR